MENGEKINPKFKITNKILAIVIICVLVVAAGTTVVVYYLNNAEEEAENLPPSISMIVGPSLGYVNQTLIFNGTMCDDSDGTILSHEWDFGDGSNGTGEIVEHSFQEPGNFTVTLVVIDDDGAESEPATIIVEIVEPEISETFHSWASYDSVEITDGESIDIFIFAEIQIGDQIENVSKSIDIVINWTGDPVCGIMKQFENGLTLLNLTALDSGTGNLTVDVIYLDFENNSIYYDAISIDVLIAPSPKFISLWSSPASISILTGESETIYIFSELIDVLDTLNISTQLTSIEYSWNGAVVASIIPGITPQGITYFEITGTSEGTSEINITAQYYDPVLEEYLENCTTVSVHIGPPVLRRVEIIPPDAYLYYFEEQNFTAIAYLTDGTVAVGAYYSWSLTGDAVGSISTDVGSYTIFTAWNYTGSAALHCVVTLDAIEVSANVTIFVFDVIDTKISTTIYDLFSVPYESWWYWRTSEELIIKNDGIPYVEVWLGSPSGNNWMYSTARMACEARNITSVNSTDRPVFVPMLGEISGGNIEIDWYANYITSDEANESYSLYLTSLYDGWFWRWNGTVTMDKTAAKMVLDITDSEFENFEAWKASSFGAFASAWSDWLALEGGDGGRVDIKYAYLYPWNPLSEEYDIEKVGDEIVFHIVDHLSWGAESLLGKWWAETFLSYEYWPEDVTFHAEIGPAWSHFDLDMATMYGLYATTDPETGVASWVFENMHADRLYSYVGSPYTSELNPYAGQEYWCFLTANAFYNETLSQDYVPWAWDLSEVNYALKIEWPDSDQIIGYQHNGSKNFDKYYTGYAVPRWIEPVPGEVPDNVMVDLVNRTILMKGPLDTVAWSQNSWASERVIDNRTRMDNSALLPFGVPYIEFQVHPTYDLSPIAILCGPDIVHEGAHEIFNGTGSWCFSGSIISYEWEFGDGTTGTGMEVAHNWTTAGVYMVNLTITDDLGRSSTVSKMIQVIVNLKPIADFFTSGALQALEIIFFNSTSMDPDGHIVSWSWDFGDGTTDSGEIVSHFYSDGKRYSVRLTVIDNKSATSSMTKIVEIVYNDTVPLAKIAAPSHAMVDEVITLDASKSTTLNGAAITDWDWDFGDGTTGSGEIVTHSWSTAGAKTVTLVVTDENGGVSTSTASASAAKVINVHSVAPAGIGIELSRHSLMPSETADLTISVVDANGNLITDFSGQVNITCNETVGVTVPASYTFDGTEGGTVTLPAAVAFANDGSYRIMAEYDAGAISGSEYASVANRTIEIRIYDIFQYPLYDFWLLRDSAYAGADQRYMTGPDPSVHIYRTNTAVYDEAQLYTTYRMELDARNVPNINMSNPTFVPIVPDWTTWIDEIPGVTGGNATYELYLDYMTHGEVIDAEAAGILGIGAAANDDGWYLRVDANLSMDRDAAARLIGLPLGLDEAGINSWWIDDYHDYDVRDAWEAQWWPAESGIDGRLDIRAAYDGYEIDILTATGADYTLTVLDGGDTINISMTRVTWGEEVIIVRQLFYGGEAFSPTDPFTPSYPDVSLAQGILPFEPWPEDMHMIVDIGPETGNVWFDTAITYGFRAWENPMAPAGTPVWRWEADLADYFPVVGVESEMDPWTDPVLLKATSYDPGSLSYEKDLIYNAAPAVVDLIAGESMVFERPNYLVVGFVPKARAGNYFDSLEVIKQWGYASYHVSGIDEYVIDAMTGNLKFVGPYMPDIVPHPDDSTIHMQPAPEIQLWLD